MAGNVTVLRPKDRTNAERRRRYRQRRSVTVRPPAVTEAVTSEVDAGVTVDTVTMCGLAGCLGTGRVTADDLQMASRLVLAFAMSLPAGSSIDV